MYNCTVTLKLLWSSYYTIIMIDILTPITHLHCGVEKTRVSKIQQSCYWYDWLLYSCLSWKISSLNT